ncbi:hypothetical protein AHF37_07073 [Paragonimus kellicotti]|nr:hypothetical protein AHF37_07073 [Paragonimus kellicotti]
MKAQHENIVTVREVVVGSNMDKIYLVMDYVEHDLKSLMEVSKDSDDDEEEEEDEGDEGDDDEDVDDRENADPDHRVKEHEITRDVTDTMDVTGLNSNEHRVPRVPSKPFYFPSIQVS